MNQNQFASAENLIHYFWDVLQLFTLMMLPLNSMMISALLALHVKHV